MHYKTCEVCGIKSGRNKGEKRLFLAKFPLDEARCKQRVKVVGKEDLAYVPIEKLHSLKHVCVKHFKPTDLIKKKTQLKKNAIPSMGLTRQPLADELLSGFPLHVAKQDANVASSSKLEMEHNYSKPFKSSISGKKREHSPEPSSSKVYKKKDKKESEIAPVLLQPSTSKIYDKEDQGPVLNVDMPEHAPVLLQPSTSKIYDKEDQGPDLNVDMPEQAPVLLQPSTSKIYDKEDQGPDLDVDMPEQAPVLLQPSTSKTCYNEDQGTELNVSMPEQALLVTPRKRKLLKRLQQYKIKNADLRKKIKDIEKIESPVLKSLVESSIKNQKRKAHGKRWSK